MTENLIDHQKLRDLCVRIQVGFGVPESDAETVADCLVEANLMGIDTHGIIRLKPYMHRIEAGGNNPRPEVRTVRENPCTALLDADNALGPVAGKRAMMLAIDKAGSNGIGMVIIRNANHYGPAGYYSRMALNHDMIGASMTNVMASMPPTNGAEVRVGNNAYSIAFPAQDEPPVVIDGATSMSSWGKLFLCEQDGTDLPEGCYVDRDGKMTVNPQDVLNGGALLPFAGHKGYGIAVAIEMLTGMLGGALLDHELPHPYKKTAEPGANTFLMAAIKIGNFDDPENFRKRMDEWIRFIRATRKKDGAERIWLPGEKEIVTRRQRLADGIPISPEAMKELQSLAGEAGTAFDL